MHDVVKQSSRAALPGTCGSSWACQRLEDACKTGGDFWMASTVLIPASLSSSRSQSQARPKYLALLGQDWHSCPNRQNDLLRSFRPKVREPGMQSGR